MRQDVESIDSSVAVHELELAIKRDFSSVAVHELEPAIKRDL